MEVDSEADSRNKLELRKQEITSLLREIEEFTDLDEDFKESQKAKWQQELSQNEHRRKDLLPEREKMHKLSQQLQRLAVKENTSKLV